MDSPSKSISQVNLTFALALFHKLSLDDKNKNIFISPFSIFTVLTELLRGAKGSTHEQISKVLGLIEAQEPQPEQPEQPKEPEEPEEPEQMEQTEQEKMPIRTQLRSAYQSQMQTRRQLRMQTQKTTKIPPYLLKCFKPQTDDDENIHVKVSKLLNEFNKEDASYTLSVANRLYGEKTYEFLKDFLADIKKYYGAGLETVDFKTKTEDARVTINDWVEEKTQGKIKEMLAEGLLDDSTRLVMVNAIYFKGMWAQKFKVEFTEDDQFRINKNDTKPVKMMRQKSKFSYRTIPEVNIKVLEMPYVKDLSMVIFLPNDIEDDTTGLERLEKELTPLNFVNWSTTMMTMGDVDVKLPRFKMEDSYDLNEVLKEMGMPIAFDVAQSDFSGMSSANDLVLSRAIHKSNVEVTEEGTEATSATGAILENRSANLAFMFFADHPFLYFIRHNPSKTVLFAGRFCSPE